MESYLQSLVKLSSHKSNDEVIAFLTSDIVREARQPVMQAGHKEGYLTKRGKNFGGWKTRYFVLSGPVLEYYESVSLFLFELFIPGYVSNLPNLFRLVDTNPCALRPSIRHLSNSVVEHTLAQSPSRVLRLVVSNVHLTTTRLPPIIMMQEVVIVQMRRNIVMRFLSLKREKLLEDHTQGTCCVRRAMKREMHGLICL